LRGLIKLLTNRCEFETRSPAEPFEIRQKIFLQARRFQPVLPDSEEKKAVLEKVAKELSTDAKTVFANLYADLTSHQRLSVFAPPTPRELLENYNLAQAQAILYRCVEMKLRVEPSEASNYRSIFGWIKHFGLIHSIRGNAQLGYEITLTGAASLFHRSQKYGIQMAVFLPALLLCRNWSFRAEINDRRGNAFYELTSDQNRLVSNRFDEPEYKNPDIEKLLKNWGKISVGWKLTENREVVDLGKTAFIPDLVLTSSGNEKIYLDILGFWTPKSLQKRLEEFRMANFRRFLICASNELRGSREEFLGESPHVIFYQNRIDPHLLLEKAKML
jgi:predicted nuclease of restriction endonuclease-like RecB superfamily